jgi:hypothetical protein
MRSYAKAVFTVATMALIGACSDKDAVAPVAETPAIVAPANFLQIGKPVVFRVNNAQGTTQQIGQHVIYIPAGAICDLTTSGYGPTTWDKDCSPLRGNIVITATVFNGLDGQPYVDFEPAMRFAPDKQVMLFFREGRSNTSSQMVSVKYCNALVFCVDESLTDSSLKPFKIGSSILGRRLKHFSGYVVAYDQCAGPCAADAGLLRRSGYMVASGEDITDVMKDDKVDSKRDEKDK